MRKGRLWETESLDQAVWFPLRFFIQNTGRLRASMGKNTGLYRFHVARSVCAVVWGSSCFRWRHVPHTPADLPVGWSRGARPAHWWEGTRYHGPVPLLLLADSQILGERSPPSTLRWEGGNNSNSNNNNTTTTTNYCYYIDWVFSTREALSEGHSHISSFNPKQAHGFTAASIHILKTRKPRHRGLRQWH